MCECELRYLCLTTVCKMYYHRSVLRKAEYAVSCIRSYTRLRGTHATAAHGTVGGRWLIRGCSQWKASGVPHSRAMVPCTGFVHTYCLGERPSRGEDVHRKGAAVASADRK